MKNSADNKRSKPKTPPQKPKAHEEKAAPEVRAAAPDTGPLADPAGSRDVYEALAPTLSSLDPASLTPLKGNLQLAAMAALSTATFVERPEVRARFALLSSVGLFDLALLDQIRPAALAAIYANHKYKLTSSTQSSAKVTPELDAKSLDVRDRMFSCAEHTLDDDAEIVPRIDAIRPGSGYLDRANDLTALADIYRDRPAAVRLDGKKFRATDEAEARSFAQKLFEALGVGVKVDGADWYRQQHLTWVNLSNVATEISRWGRALYAHDNPDARFPDLVGASRAPWGSVRRPVKTEPTPPVDGPK